MAFNSRNNLSSEPRTILNTEWVRPSDWPTITDAPNQIQVLLNDTNRATYWFDFYYAGNDVTIDWGDGVVDTLPSGGSGTMARVNHTYTPGTGATCSLGYTTFVAKFSHATSVGKVFPTSHLITLTADDGTLLGTQYSFGILEMYMGDNCYDFDYTNMFFCNSLGSRYNQLKYVKFPINTTNMALNSSFDGCYSLAKVDLPQTMFGSINMQNAFRSCINLISIEIPETPDTGITSMNSAFSSCRSLKDVKFKSHLNNLTQMDSGFFACNSLVYIDMPPMPNCTSMFLCFSDCSNLQSFVFKTLPNKTTAYRFDLNSMFRNCFSLENVEFPNEFVNGEFAGSGGNAFDVGIMFQFCYSLRGLTYPKNWSPNQAATTHQDCINLQYVNYQTPIFNTSLNYQNHFQGCRSLKAVYFGGEKNVVNMTATSGNVTLSSFFLNCFALSEIKLLVIASGTITMQSCFQGCSGLIYVDAREVKKDDNSSNITTLSNCFNGCITLETILFQDDLNVVTDLTSAFNGCNSLKQFHLPNTLVTTNYTTCFANCFSLEKLTFGTTGTGTLLGIGAMFQNCYALKEVDLTNIFSTSGKAAAITSLLNLFQNCYSLERINMGNFQLSGITAFGGLVTLNTSLETITNSDKIGNPSTSTGTYLQWSNAVITAPQLQALTISSRVSLINLSGTSTGIYNLQTLRLTNHSAGQFTATAIAIQIQWCNMGYAALIDLFNDLAAKPNVSGRSINITGNPGVASLTAADRLIITSKGWTIIS